jgi:hypothetical protein
MGDKNLPKFKLILMVALLSACTAQHVVPVATGGSKADASVEMGYNTGLFHPAEPDWPAAQVTASKRCQAWGYSKAEGFEGTTLNCNRYNGYGQCLDGTVTRTYQCLN